MLLMMYVVTRWPYNAILSGMGQSVLNKLQLAIGQALQYFQEKVRLFLL
jgi:hypothetical protein